MSNKILDPVTLTAFINWMRSKKLEVAYDDKKRQLSYSTDKRKLASLRLPLQMEFIEETMSLKTVSKHWILLLVRAGTASVGYFENGENVDHKVFRAYMVRKKQGKSQVKYLKTKGKSRAGSRVRLASTTTFFQEINQRLTAYLSEYHVDHVGISCAKTLWPYLFEVKNDSPLSKKDSRILKIPKHIQNPTYETLLHINGFMQKGELMWEERDEIPISAFLGKYNEASSHTDEDW